MIKLFMPTTTTSTSGIGHLDPSITKEIPKKSSKKSTKSINLDRANLHDRHFFGDATFQ